ncbi:MAG TPA: phosphatase PAP2 family protein [Aeromicrobium sp.]|nr:phosphatase PAP2 family protein [Aeromicrobium sp.]
MRRWPYTFLVILSALIGITAVVASQRLGVPLRDPEGFLGPAYVRLPALAILFFALGIIPQAIRREGVRGMRTGIMDILREEWNLVRVVNIMTGLFGFYICYVSYRNIKSYLPLIRENVLFDHDMLQLDHFLMFGHNPAPLLHDWLGTTFSAEILATSYLSYLPLIPITLGLVLTWSKNASLGAWYATALSLNWVLGAFSYYILPTLGPAFFQPSMFADLPDSSVTRLQNALFRNGIDFKADPTGSDIYGIAGFASLHVSVVVTACLFFSRTGQRLAIRIAGYVFLVTTVLATVYFGWHYLADDIAGAFIGWAAVSVGAWATGNRGRRRRRRLGDSTNEEPDEEPDEDDSDADESVGAVPAG